MAAPELARLQRWMQAVIADVDGAHAGVEGALARAELDVTCADLERVIAPSPTLAPLERVEIYANMVLWRLHDCLAEDYPALRFTLGGDRFSEVVKGYLREHPSQHFSLNQLGARLPVWLARQGKLARSGFLVELASLERAVQEVFDAHASEPITAAELEAVPQSDWAELQLVTSPALRLFDFRWPTNRYYTAFKSDAHPRPPKLEATRTVVYRHSWRVWRADLTREQHALLGALMQGLPLAAAIERCAATRGLDLQLLSTSLAGWFREWTSEGLFVGLSTAH